MANATHKNNVGCSGQGWNFDCAGNGPYDVGFGVIGSGSNDNEVDGELNTVDEFVQVDFGGKVLKVTGFAGMLTYDDGGTVPAGDREQVQLEYRVGGGAWQNVLAEPIFAIGSDFDTVGLAFRNDLSLFADTVRFRAFGVGNADDGTFNITAAGLKVAAIPLPAGGLLLLTALGGVAALRRKRKAT